MPGRCYIDSPPMPILTIFLDFLLHCNLLHMHRPLGHAHSEWDGTSFDLLTRGSVEGSDASIGEDGVHFEVSLEEY